MDDTELIRLFASRTERAISETEQKYGIRCRRFAERILHNPEDAEECVNDVLLQAWNAIPPEQPGRLSAWLTRVTRNLAVSRLREKTAEKRGGTQIPLVLDELAECLSGGTEPERELERGELTEAVNRFLSGLKREERDLFVARYFFAASHAELAERTGWSVGKIKTTLRRSRMKLQAQLKEEGLC